VIRLIVGYGTIQYKYDEYSNMKNECVFFGETTCAKSLEKYRSRLYNSTLGVMNLFLLSHAVHLVQTAPSYRHCPCA